eukprot:gene2966-3251_t
MSESSCASGQSYQDSIADKGRRQQANLTSLLSMDAGKALLWKQLMSQADSQAEAEEPSHAAHTALKVPPQGQSVLHRQISNYLQRRQLLLQQQEGAASAPGSPAPAQATKTLISLHPKALSTALAVSRTSQDSAQRAAGLALLKQQLVAQALATAGSQTAANLTAAVDAAAGHGQPTSPTSSHVGAFAQAGLCLSPGQYSPALGSACKGPDAEGTTCSLPWSLLQQILQQQAEEQCAAASSALSRGISSVHRYDLLASSGDFASHQYAARSLAAGSEQPIFRSESLGTCTVNTGAGPAAAHRSAASHQVVFKRRAANSTALRKHFSTGGLHRQTSTAASKAAVETIGALKPQHVFKKQKKKPLMLWSAGSSVAQQMQAERQMLSQQQRPAESEPTHQTTSSAAAAAHCNNTWCSGAGAPRVVAPAAASPAAVVNTGVESVLTELARQEQQLLLLQQQLRQQRHMIIERRQQRELAESVAVAAASKDVDMTEAALPSAACSFPTQPLAAVAAPEQPQSTGSAVAPPEAITALMAIANALAAQQQQPSSVPFQGEAVDVSSPWGDEVVHQLTAALLAA